MAITTVTRTKIRCDVPFCGSAMSAGTKNGVSEERLIQAAKELGWDIRTEVRPEVRCAECVKKGLRVM